MTEIIPLRQQCLTILHLSREVSESLPLTYDRLRCSCTFYIFDEESKDVAVGAKALSVTWYFQCNKVNRMRIYMPDIPELLETFNGYTIDQIRVKFAIGLDKTTAIVPIEQHCFVSRSAPAIISRNSTEIHALITVFDITPEKEMPNNAGRFATNK